ncbi:MAG: PAS domain S-box protein [Proteobacteria bacterium]|nr:MAG: PAS domain S-box protein [Pseudomonadota bacterium]
MKIVDVGPDRSNLVLVACLLMAAAVFVVDLWIPLGVAAGVLYVLVILVSSALPQKNTVIFLAIVCTALTIVAFFVSPEGGELWKVVFNRVLSIFAVWVTVLLSLVTKERGALASGQTQALRANEGRLRAILDNSVDPIITIREDGYVESFSKAAERLFGYSSQEVIGRNISMIMPEPYSSEHDSYLANYLETGQAKIIGIGREVTGQRKDGVTFPLSLAVTEVETEGRRFFTGMVRDLTDEKLAQEKLLQAERLAAIGQVVAGLTHESRNALQRTLSSLDRLELDLEGQDDALALIARARVAQAELQILFEEVRSYAAPFKLDLKYCDLLKVWRRAWDESKPALERKEIHLVEEVDDLDLECEVDELRIRQVFRNIFENAISASPEKGKIVLHCELTQIAEQSAFRITICDEGPGIPIEQQEKVFEPFFTTKSTGTGLGMAIASRIVKAHRGQISAGNVGAGGAEIEIVLPRDAS